jgi:hypothetical protein
MKAHQKSLIKIFKQRFSNDVFVGAEVGVWKGETSKVLLTTFPKLCLILVDPWKAWEMNSSYQETDKMGKLTEEQWAAIRREAEGNVKPFLLRATILRKVSAEAVKLVDDRSLDFVFLDGDHSYEAVKNDIQAWTPKIRKGGILCGHDYRASGDKWEGYGVQRAIHELIGRENIHSYRGLLWSCDVV